MVKKSDWKIVKEMPAETAEFTLEMNLNETDMSLIREGLCPKQMEDKWFIYFEDDTLYMHRSWTGYCRYTAVFLENGIVKVTVNRNPEQYNETNIEIDKIDFNILINGIIGRSSRDLMMKYVKKK
ncbi:MAG: hypothetical protein K2K91_03510 [Ruminococcus sp.]|nr:hypothetical protein [Ruminococcus sp.]